MSTSRAERTPFESPGFKEELFGMVNCQGMSGTSAFVSSSP